jgi:dipeptidyl-peptidase-4
MKRIHGALLLCLASAACHVSGDPDSRRSGPQGPQRAPRVTLDELLELLPKTKVPPGAPGAFGGWTGERAEYFSTEDEQGETRLVVVDATTGARREFHDPEAMQAALSTQAGLDAGKARELSRRAAYTLSKDRRLALFNEDGDLYVYRFDTGSAARLTRDGAEELGETFSPDGAWISFVRDSNLQVVSAGGGEARALTFGGDEAHLFGRLDWLYQEEVYGRGDYQAHWWSPDSRRIALLALDQTEVPKFTIVDTRQTRPQVEVWRYPKAGDPNPKVRLALAGLAEEGLLYADLSAYPEDLLIVRVAWTPDSREVFAQVQDRGQTWLDLVAVDAASGKARRLFRDTTPAWSLPSQGPFFVQGGDEFVISSERDGFEHLYLYKRDGSLVRRLTQGAHEVDSVLRVDAATRSVWFAGDAGDVRGNRVYRVSLDGGEPQLLTPEAGTHTAVVSPEGTHFVDTHSAAGKAPVTTLHDAAGTGVRPLARADQAAFDRLGFPAPEFHRPRTPDGFELEAMLYKPADFDPDRRYPLLCFVYGGPHAPQVRDAFHNLNSLYHSWLADQGILVWVVDNRSASGKGLVSAAASYRRFGPGELADVEAGLDYVIAQGSVDPARVGIWGWSFGGYLTAYAMTHSTRFKVGISGAPVTDWRLYDSIYTERYMGTPEENEAGYREASVLAAAGNLRGRLLLICGEIDENVHAQNTLQLAGALQKAGKSFDLMVYPGNRHSVVEPSQRRHLYGMMAEYLLTHL